MNTQNTQDLTILYERLSRDDGDDSVSNSILNQRKLLQEYAERIGLVPYIHVEDDGYTGTNWNRPGWKRIVDEIDAGCVSKQYFVNSYSLLQDRYFEYMKAAGFEGFERGERGSTAEHLDVLDFKIKQDTIRASELESDIEEMEASLEELDKDEEKKEARLDRLDERIKAKEKARATISEVDAMGKPAMLGGYSVTADDMKKLKALAKKSVTADGRIRKAKKDFETEKNRMAERCAQLESDMRDMQRAIASLSRERDAWKRNYENLWGEVREFIHAIRNIPNRLREFLAGIGFGKSRNREIER